MLDEEGEGKKDSGDHDDAVKNIQLCHRDHACEQGVGDDKESNDDHPCLRPDFSFSNNLEHPASSAELIADNRQIGNNCG